MYRGSGLTIGNTYGSGTGQIWLNNSQCSGNETSFINCVYDGWEVHNCSHDKDVSIICGDGTGTLLTLVGLLYAVSEYET